MSRFKIREIIFEKFLNYGKINFKNCGKINFIDVGSSNGKIPSPWYENSKYIKNLLCFDPFNKTSITDNILFSEKALWSECKTLQFYIYKGEYQSGASFYHQNVEFVKQNFDKLSIKGNKHLAKTWFERSTLIDSKEVTTSTLDIVVEELGQGKIFDFLKIDAQGAEFEILNGASNTLKNCLGLQLELFTIPLYKGIKLQNEVIQYLDKLGFDCVKILPPHGSFHSQNDCIFFNRNLRTEKEDEFILLNKIYKLK